MALLTNSQVIAVLMTDEAPFELRGSTGEKKKNRKVLRRQSRAEQAPSPMFSCRDYIHAFVPHSNMSSSLRRERRRDSSRERCVQSALAFVPN